jgi:hypothetical protein
MKRNRKMFKTAGSLARWTVLPVALLVIAPDAAKAAHFDGIQTGPSEWTYTLTYDPQDNYAVCPPPGDIATITLSGLQGVVDATAPTSTDFVPVGGMLDTGNQEWIPEVSADGTSVTWTHNGPGTGNFGIDKHVYGFKVITASPATNGTVDAASEGFSVDVSDTGPCPVIPEDDRDFTHTTNGPVGLAVLPVTIDIKPGGVPNSINPRSKGVIPVAVLTTETFDATTIDWSTVHFGASGSEAAAVHYAMADVDGDGDTDMIFHFRTQETGIACGDTTASLTGQTFGAQIVEGSDSINTVGCE